MNPSLTLRANKDITLTTTKTAPQSNNFRTALRQPSNVASTGARPMADRSEHLRPLTSPLAPPLTAPRTTWLLVRLHFASSPLAPAALATSTSRGGWLARRGHFAQTLLPVLSRNRQHQYEIGWQPPRCPHAQQLGGPGCQQLVTRPAAGEQMAAVRLALAGNTTEPPHRIPPSLGFRIDPKCHLPRRRRQPRRIKTPGRARPLLADPCSRFQKNRPRPRKISTPVETD